MTLEIKCSGLVEQKENLQKDLSSQKELCTKAEEVLMSSNIKISTFVANLEHLKGDKQSLVEEVERMRRSIEERQQEIQSLKSGEVISNAVENIWEKWDKGNRGDWTF